MISIIDSIWYPIQVIDTNQNLCFIGTDIAGGQGLWSLWTRNFKSPLLMLMDLVDNAVDATMHPEDADFTSRVQIYRDLYEVMPEQTCTTVSWGYDLF